MVDQRIVPDLRWIAARYPIYITDGYSGPLPNGEHVGCDNCHVKNSDHYNGLAVDIVPLEPELQMRRQLGRRSPASPSGPSRNRTSRCRPSAGSATTATPATAAATTSTSPGTTRRRRVPARRMGRSLPRQLHRHQSRRQEETPRGPKAPAGPPGGVCPGSDRRRLRPPARRLSRCRRHPRGVHRMRGRCVPESRSRSACLCRARRRRLRQPGRLDPGRLPRRQPASTSRR